jgi:hypothetical protein
METEIETELEIEKREGGKAIGNEHDVRGQGVSMISRQLFKCIFCSNLGKHQLWAVPLLDAMTVMTLMI